MKRAEDSPEAGGPCYTLYLEYLGGLVPILKGRRISKLRPEFVIMDPKTDSKTGGFYINIHEYTWMKDKNAAIKTMKHLVKPFQMDTD